MEAPKKKKRKVAGAATSPSVKVERAAVKKELPGVYPEPPSTYTKPTAVRTPAPAPVAATTTPTTALCVPSDLSASLDRLFSASNLSELSVNAALKHLAKVYGWSEDAIAQMKPIVKPMIKAAVEKFVREH